MVDVVEASLTVLLLLPARRQALGGGHHLEQNTVSNRANNSKQGLECTHTHRAVVGRLCSTHHRLDRMLFHGEGLDTSSAAGGA